MAYQVFISHSTADMGLVDQLKYWLEVNGIEAYVAQIYPQPGMTVSDKVTNAIQNSDCLVALLTADGARSQWVRDELAYAISLKDKTGRPAVVPLVEEEVGPSLRGLVADKDQIRFSRQDPTEAVSRTIQFIYSLKVSKETQQATAATALLILGLLAVAALSSRNKEYVA